MLKQLFMTAIVAAGAATMQAADYTAYANGAIGSGLNLNHWWNCAFNPAAENPAGDGKVLSMTYSEYLDGNFCAGLQTAEGSEVAGPLHSATFSFQYYATTPCDITIRLTDPETDKKFSVSEADVNKWNTVSYSVPTDFPAVAEKWNTAGNGTLFGVVVENFNADTKVYFNNVVYSGIDEAWTKPEQPEQPEQPELPAPTTVPTPTLPADEVLSLFGSAYTPAVNPVMQYWGQSTAMATESIDGKEVIRLTAFNYIGWADFNLNVSEMTHLHVDCWTPDATKFEVAPISLYPTVDPVWSAPEVKQGEWNSYDIPLSYSPNLNLQSIEQFKFAGGNGSNTCYVTNVYFYKQEGGGEEPVEPVEPGATYAGRVKGTVKQDMGQGEKEYPYALDYEFTYNEDKTISIKFTLNWTDGAPVGAGGPAYTYLNGAEKPLTAAGNVYSFTTTDTYEAGQIVNIGFKTDYALGSMRPADIPYTVGSKAELSKVPEITAKAQKISDTTAEIAYEVSLPDELAGAAVTVFYNDDIATESPIVLSGLTPGTLYTYEVYVRATPAEGDPVESEPVTVSFTTLPDGTVSVAGNTLSGSKTFLHSFNGSPARFITMNYAVTALEDGKLKVTYTTEPADVSIVGLVAFLQVNNGAALDKAGDEGPWEFTLDGPFANGQEIALNGYCNYAGGSTSLFNIAYKYGEVAEMPEPDTFLFKVSETEQTAAGVEVSYDVYLSESMKDAEISVEWTATPVEEVAEQSLEGVATLSGTSTESPIVIAGVKYGTKYKIILKPTAKLGDKVVSAESIAANVDYEFTTSISEIMVCEADAAVIYDLHGRRLAAPVRGLNIINGHKVIVK